jgi:SP family myo-inositol transporter-like MFS transporter 13
MATFSAEQPLMQREEDDDNDTISEIDLNNVEGLLEKNLRSPGLFVWLLTFSAGISGLLFGCKKPLPSS